MDIYLSTQPFRSVADAYNVGKAVGYDGLELFMRPSGRFSLRTLRGQLTPSQLDFIKVVHAPTGKWHAFGFASLLQKGLDLAAQAHAPLVNIHPPSRRWFIGGKLTQDMQFESISTALDGTQKRVAIEVVGPDTKKEHRLRRPYRHPKQWRDDILRLQLWATVDTTHLAAWGENPVEYLRALRERVAHIHASDYDPYTKQQHCIIGRGSLDWRDVMAAAQVYCPEATLTVELSSRYTGKELTDGVIESLIVLEKQLR